MSGVLCILSKIELIISFCKVCNFHPPKFHSLDLFRFVCYSFVYIIFMDLSLLSIFFPYSRGASCGILIMWDRRVVEKFNECMWEFSLAVTFRNVEDHFTWAFAGVYGPNSDRDRGSFGMSWLVYSAGETCLSA